MSYNIVNFVYNDNVTNLEVIIMFEVHTIDSEILNQLENDIEAEIEYQYELNQAIEDYMLEIEDDSKLMNNQFKLEFSINNF